ncbi:hypothetical protein AQPE_2792 [Aquipluma nitroreducens]|uniref:Uncharacterized protein n=1 Tax=Aquipluma nitroreducens TaxID=2010828 RepID=A0A5K7SAX5_9BACT|nr:hypothetical protein AQPE_2792 [Aquipluma nitroreducens]
MEEFILNLATFILRVLILNYTLSKYFWFNPKAKSNGRV